MEIRFAIKKDMSQLVALCKEHAAYEHADYDPKNKLQLLTQFIFEKNPCLQCIVVEEENSIIGYATYMKQFSTWDCDFYIYLDCLFLKANARGKGLGKLVMNELKKQAKIQNCNTIQWQTPDFNTKAIHFYQKMGAFSKTKERFFLDV